MRGLTWQTLRLSLAGSLDTGDDVRAGDPREMDIARDVVFDESGGAQTRPPFGAAMSSVFGGGTLSNCRRLATVNGELVLLTDTVAYSWNDQLDKWVSRGTHLAVSVDEAQRFATPGDQLDADRAELSGTIVYAWTEGAGAATSVYAAAVDKATGSVLVSPTAISPAATFAGRARLVALATKILLFADDGGGNLKVRAIDPADPATGFASAATTVLAAAFFGKYDVVRVDGADQCVGACNRNPTTSYTAFTVTAGLTVATSTKARTCDGPIAVASTPAGTQVQVVRGNVANAQGDLLTISTLADVFTAQAIGSHGGTAFSHITVTFTSATSATAFWSNDETTGPLFAQFATKTNTVTTANVVGTQATLVMRLGIASRAFTYGGAAFVWLVFAEQSANAGTGVGLGIRAQLQNTYLLYRADGHIAGKAVWQIGGGYTASSGYLPGVSAISSTKFAWCGGLRRRIELGGTEHTGYAARAPVDITFSFDDNAARRAVQLGRTLYVAGAVPLQYDGFSLTEIGFLNYPWSFATQDPGVPGNLAVGAYSWKSTWKWTNGQGEVERSTTATGEQLTIAATRFIILSLFFLFATRKLTPRPVTVEVWRTTVNAPPGAPYYLITGQDPTVLTGDNCFVPNLPAPPSTTGFVLNDNFADATLITKETNPENGAILESLAPPGAAIVVATDTRLFLAGIPGDSDRVWYSRERNDGEVASFHEILTVDVPPKGGAITSLWFQDEVLYVGRETAIYALPGVGLDNLGQGQNYGPAREVSLDVGPVSQEALARTPLGTIFKSRKGWYLHERGGGVRLIGSAVSVFDSETVHAVTVLESTHQVRILTSGRLLLWCYKSLVDPTDRDGVGKWAEWTISDGIHACMWQGHYVYLTATGPRIEAADFTGTAHGMDVESKWLPLPELQAAAKVRAAGVLGEYRSAHLVRLRAARDWQYDGSGNVVYFDDHAWSPSPTTVGSALQVMFGLTQDSMQALKLRITAVTDAARATLVTTTLSPQVITSGMAWNATWRAASVASGLTAYGEMGNRLTMSLGFTTFVAPTPALFPYDLPFDFVSDTGKVVVNDHFTWNATTQRWDEALNNIGVLVSGTLTVAELEAAIAEGTALATLQTADAAPTKAVDVAGMLAALVTPDAGFSGGAYGVPTGEALKLTNLALEVGLRTGLTKRLPAEQRA